MMKQKSALDSQTVRATEKLIPDALKLVEKIWKLYFLEMVAS